MREEPGSGAARAISALMNALLEKPPLTTASAGEVTGGLLQLNSHENRQAVPRRSLAGPTAANLLNFALP